MAKAKKTKQNYGEVVEFSDELVCERCGKEGAADFVGEILCKQCIADDVFSEFNETEN